MLGNLRRPSPTTIALLVLLVALSGTAVASGTEEAVGANCVKPLDLLSAFQDLSNCNLKGVTIDGNVPVPGSNPLYGSNLSGANLNGATIEGGYKPLQFANLSGSNLNGATLGGGPNELAVLQSANLSGANLNGAIISGFRPLQATNLSGANLRGASVTGIDPLLEALYSNTTCPDGTNSDNDGGTCVGHGVP